jgi:RNA polymerase sigma-70 factor (ECF subfamily)
MPTPDQSAGGPPLADRTDRSLLLRLRRGEDDAATALYVRYARRLLALTRSKTSSDLDKRVEAEDIVQSVFLSFFRKANDGAYDVPEGTELWNLLLVITINKIRAKGNYVRAAKRDVRRSQPATTPEAEGVAAPDHIALAELQMVIRDVLAELPAKSAEIVELRIAGLEAAEIAERTRRSKRTVERTLQDFRQRLTALLTEAP